MFSVLKRAVARPTRVREGLPLSPNEERYVLAETMTGQVYAAPVGMRIRGDVDMSRLEEILQATCDRHEARRTGFEATEDGRFSKYVETRAQVRLEKLDMPGATPEQLRDAVRRHVFQRGDLSPATLHRYILIRIAADDCVFGYSLHHATSDGVTGMAFMVEVFSRLFGLEITDKPTQYNDYWDFDWENWEAYKTAQAFWIERLSGLQSEDAGVWPYDRAPQGPAESRPGVTLQLPPELAAASRRAADEIGVTDFTFFYAVYMVMLSRLTGADRVCTTFQSAGRRGKPGAETAHGVFSNSLIMATQVDEGQSIRTLASRLRGEIREAIAHEIFPYHRVIRATGVHPRYAINWYPRFAVSGGVEGVTFESIELDENQDDDDLNFRIYGHGDQLAMTAFYNPAGFSRERVAALAAQFANLAAAFCADIDAPTGAIRSADVAPAGVLPNPESPLIHDLGEPIHAAFLARAGAAPETLALTQGEVSWTYGDLDGRSRTLADRLRNAGVTAGDRVAILADRCPDLVCAMLAVCRAGGVFAVLDAAYPEPRLAQLVETSAPRAVVWAGDPRLEPLAARLAPPRAPVLAAEVAGERHPPADEELPAPDPSEPAYILFTSGSTGRPKAVACSHAPLSRFVRWQAETFGLTRDDRFTALSGLSHDPFLRDVFTPLSLGATVLMPPTAVITEPGALAPWLRETDASVCHLTPALGHILSAEAARVGTLPALRRLFWGGDLLRPRLATDVAKLAPGAEQVNFYGSTETPQAVAYFRLDGDNGWASVPIGSGAAGAQILILDAAGRQLGIGEVGEIAVRSTMPSLGYVQNGRITAPAERREMAGASVHFTGDRGVYLPSGDVLLIGRADDQVKVRGNRVELAEVTAALLARPGVREAVSLATGEGQELRIVGFVAGRRPAALEEAELRSSLSARLPAYMVPHRIVAVDTLPLLPNGKVDRQRLLDQMELSTAAPESDAPGLNDLERSLMAKWAGVLGRQAISRTSTFASLGGDSLSYVQAYLAAEEIIGEVPVDWQVMTIAELAARRRAVASGWTAVDMPILMRACAIFLVVAGHLDLFHYGGGATSALMLVSGYILGGLGLQEAFSRRDAEPLLRTVRSILVPTLALSALLWLFRTPGRMPEPYILLLTADLQDFSANEFPQEIYLWFVHCLLHMMVLIWLAVLGLKAVKGLKMGRTRFLWGLFGVACAARFLFPWVLDHDFFTPGHHRNVIYMLPTTHLATLALGGLATVVTGRGERLRLMGVMLAYAALSTWFFGPSQGVFLLVGGILLAATPRLRLPGFVSAAVFSLAGASLWIYLTHMMVRDSLNRLGLDQPVLAMTAALLVGIGTQLLWRRGLELGGRLVRRPLIMAGDTAV